MDEDHFTVESKGSKKKNFFDEDISEDAARSMFKSSHHGFTVSFSSESEPGFEEVVYQNHSKPRPAAPDLSPLATPASRVRPVAENKTMSNSSSFGGTTRALDYGHNRSKSMTFGGAPERPDNKPIVPMFSREETILKDAAIPENSLGQSSPSTSLLSFEQATPMKFDKMQQEIQSLKRSLLSARKDRWMKLPVEDTLRRILKGEDFSLEMYKSLSDKLSLLDQAVRLHDGNAIITAVLFLQKTVTKRIFTRELLQRPVAADHYLTYLKAHFDFPEYISTLIMLGRTEEAAICKYQMALPASEVSIKISKVQDCLRGHFQGDQALSNDSALVHEYVDLLERQRPIDEADANLEASGRSALFRDFPRKRSLIDMPVVTTLYYCCLYHYDLSENSLASPAALRKRHQISEKQYTWTAIGARAKLRQWKDIETMLTTKTWLGGVKLKAAIGFDKVVGILHRNGAPPDILEKYLAMVDNLELRLTLAKKVSCPIAVIKALLAMSNRAELEQFAAKLDRYSKEGLYAYDVLNNSSIKWK